MSNRRLQGRIITALSGHIVDAGALGILGYGALLPKLHWAKITHDDDVEECRGMVRKLTDGRITAARWRKRFIDSDGGVVPTMITTRVIRNEDGTDKHFESTLDLLDGDSDEPTAWECATCDHQDDCGLTCSMR